MKINERNENKKDKSHKMTTNLNIFKYKNVR